VAAEQFALALEKKETSEPNLKHVLKLVFQLYGLT